MADEFRTLIAHLAAQAEPDDAPVRAMPPLNLADPRHAIAYVMKQMRYGTTADDAYTFLLTVTAEKPSALLYIHMLGLAAERFETNPTAIADIGYLGRILPHFVQSPPPVDRDAIAASTTWPHWAAGVHASIRRRLTKHGFGDIAAMIGRIDAALGIDDVILNPPAKRPQRRQNQPDSAPDNVGVGSPTAARWSCG